MLKCEVLADSSLVVKKGSTVIVDEKQFELARRILKPIVEEKKKTKKK